MTQLRTSDMRSMLSARLLKRIECDERTAADDLLNNANGKLTLEVLNRFSSGPLLDGFICSFVVSGCKNNSSSSSSSSNSPVMLYTSSFRSFLSSSFAFHRRVTMTTNQRQRDPRETTVTTSSAPSYPLLRHRKHPNTGQSRRCAEKSTSSASIASTTPHLHIHDASLVSSIGRMILGRRKLEPITSSDMTISAPRSPTSGFSDIALETERLQLARRRSPSNCSKNCDDSATLSESTANPPRTCSRHDCCRIVDHRSISCSSVINYWFTFATAVLVLSTGTIKCAAPLSRLRLPSPPSSSSSSHLRLPRPPSSSSSSHLRLPPPPSSAPSSPLHPSLPIPSLVSPSTVELTTGLGAYEDDTKKVLKAVEESMVEAAVAAGSRSRRSDSMSSFTLTDGPGVPCIYEGHITTDRDWYGYIANISIRTTGQLGFEFVYPADKCCQNVLFYLDEQAAIISPRMNCWQREYLLRPEDDQMLRLTPSFSWSGCHVVASADDRVGDVFVCKGGRSFSVDVSDGGLGHLTTWQVAVSNCATLNGIELRYRLEVFGHVGECTGRRPEVEPTSLISSRFKNAAGNGRGNERVHADNDDVDTAMVLSGSGGTGSRSSVTAREAGGHHRGSKSANDDEQRLCVVVGDVNTTYSWYGFLRNLSLNAGGGYRFMFTYPPSMQIQNIILYNDEDVHHLDWEQSCWQKEGVIGADKVLEQIIDMSVQSTWSGCSVNETQEMHSYNLQHSLDEFVANADLMQGANLTCQGERRYDSASKVFIALSNCRGNGKGLRLRYRLEIFGYAKDDLCARSSSSTSARHPIIYAGLSLLNLVFGGLFAGSRQRTLAMTHCLIWGLVSP